jgi:hypothetical protein
MNPVGKRDCRKASGKSSGESRNIYIGENNSCYSILAVASLTGRGVSIHPQRFWEC